MSASLWRPVGSAAPGALREARLQAHYAVQWLARTARAHVPAQPDDRHTNLGWDDTLDGVTTHAIVDGWRLGLGVAALRLVLLDREGQPAQSFDLDGRTDVDARAWLGQRLNERGLDACALDAALPYDLPAHPLASGSRYTMVGLAEAFSELAAWYANADDALGEARRPLLARHLNAPPVRCWPHHFDLDTLIVFESKDARNAHSMGVGFSPGDEYYEEPYFYVSAFPAPDAASLSQLPAIGHWHTRNFTGAVARAGRIVSAADPKAEIEAFLRAATEIVIGALR